MDSQYLSEIGDDVVMNKAWIKQNLLSFDAGGSRSYWSLLALKELMKYVAIREEQIDGDVLHSFYPEEWPDELSDLPGTAVKETENIDNAHGRSGKLRAMHKARRYLPCHYFDYICGSDSGALIAIMLGRLRMTVLDCIDEYKVLSEKVFGKPRFFSLLNFGLGNRTKYKGARLENAFQDITARRNDPQYEYFPSAGGTCRTFVTAIATGPDDLAESLYLIRSYDHERELDPSPSDRTVKRTSTLNYVKAQRLHIWEVARAATAAPYYFEPFKVTPPESKDPIIFGSCITTSNNPTLVGVEELRDVSSNRKLDIAVSIGTSRRNKSMNSKSFFSMPKAVPTFTRIRTDPEAAHKSINRRKRADGFLYHRLNDPNALDVAFDEWEPRSTSSNKASGSSTMAKIEMAFAMWATDQDVQKQLQECAAALVRSRRARRFDIDKWERFATGARFMCRYPECSVREFTDRTTLRTHLQNTHSESPETYERKDSYNRQNWRYKSAPSAATWPLPMRSQRVRDSASLEALPSTEDRTSARQQQALKDDIFPGDQSPENHVNNDESMESTPADAFVEDPQSYFDTLQDLHTRVLELGQEYINNIVSREKGHILMLPATDDPAAKSVKESLGCLRPLLERNLGLLSSILQGLHILNSVDFCKPIYNIIVHDALRADVLRVVPIDASTLFLLQDLVEEALVNCVPSQWTIFLDVIKDVQIAVRLILDHLGLLTTSFVAKMASDYEDFLSICQLLSSTASVLFIGLVSFVRSHLALSDQIPGVNTQLSIQTINEPVIMGSKRLACLDACIQRPVWAFDRGDLTRPGLQHSDRYAVSIFLADLADLWGPINLKYLGDNDTGVAEIKLRGGVIRKAESNDFGPCLANETHCHWYSWSNDHSEKGVSGTLSTTGRLLVGAQTDTITLADTSMSTKITCRDRSYVQAYRGFELGTKESSWHRDGRTAQASAGKFANVTVGQIWKYDTGWTLKDIIIDEWMESFEKRREHQPKPLYLDYMTVIETSGCSGHCRRISLWQLIASNTVDGFILGILDNPQERQDFKAIKAHGMTLSFANIWKTNLSRRDKELVKDIVYELLRVLRRTGVVEERLLQTWDVTTHDRIDGRKIDPRWASMVKDDTASATFAVLTNRCFKFSNVHNSHQELDEPILFTKICITVSRPINRRVCDSKSLGQFRVMHPLDLSALDDDRLRAPEEARLASGPDFSSLRERQSQRKQKQKWRAKSNAQKKIDTESSAYMSKRISLRSISRRHENLTVPPDGSQEMYCNRCLDFNNGKGNRIGTLTLRFHRAESRINLSRLSENQPLPVGWDTSKESVITKIPKRVKAKVREMDDAAIELVKRNFTSPLQGLLEPDPGNDSFREFAVEHQRGGNPEEGQKLLNVHVS